MMYELKEFLRDRGTELLIKGIEILNQVCDRSLAWKLHKLADRYDNRPTGEWG
jgi:hypothetical protein